MKVEAQNIAQWYVIFIIFIIIIIIIKLSNSATTTHGKFQQTFGDDAVSRTQAFRWHNMFSEGKTLVEDEQFSGQPSATQTGDNTAQVRGLVRSDQRLTVRMISDEVNMNRETVTD
jgi:predicted ATP-dependent protease